MICRPEKNGKSNGNFCYELKKLQLHTAIKYSVSQKLLFVSAKKYVKKKVWSQDVENEGQVHPRIIEVTIQLNY